MRLIKKFEMREFNYGCVVEKLPRFFIELFHIGLEFRLFDVKSTIAENGMGMTSRP